MKDLHFQLIDIVAGLFGDVHNLNDVERTSTKISEPKTHVDNDTFLRRVSRERNFITVTHYDWDKSINHELAGTLYHNRSEWTELIFLPSITVIAGTSALDYLRGHDDILSIDSVKRMRSVRSLKLLSSV